MNTFARLEVLGRLGAGVADHGNYVSFIVLADKTVYKDKQYTSVVQGYHMKALSKGLINYVKKSLGKGDLVYIEATPDFSQFTNKKGETEYGKSFVVDKLIVLKKSPNAPKDANGNYIPQKPTDKTKGKPKQEVEEYDFEPEQDELEESTGKGSVQEGSDEVEEDEDFFDLGDLEL